jgi:hypothetical protein
VLKKAKLPVGWYPGSGARRSNYSRTTGKGQPSSPLMRPLIVIALCRLLWYEIKFAEATDTLLPT